MAAEQHYRNKPPYLPVAWASHIDQKVLWEPDQRPTGGTRGKKQELHTVCQHVYWDEAAPCWTKAGVTDVWLSHAAETGVRPGNIPSAKSVEDHHWRIHPWPLYAVNVEDPQRRAGLVVGKNPRRKRYLASFIGAHMPHYLSDTRLRLRMHENNPSFHIRITGNQWHLHGPSWQHQVEGLPLAEVYKIGDDVRHYNAVLSESVFALCPAGAGRNTIRLWEALAVGAIPVLLDPAPAWPRQSQLPPIDWGNIVLQLTHRDIPRLPAILRSIPADQILARQRLAIEAYQMTRSMRCEMAGGL